MEGGVGREPWEHKGWKTLLPGRRASIKREKTWQRRCWLCGEQFCLRHWSKKGALG